MSSEQMRNVSGLLCFMFCTMIGCASENVRNATIWLAAASNEVKDKAVVLKDQRDALASARQMGISSLERTTSSLEAQTAETVLLWTIADPPGAINPQKVLLDKIYSQIAVAEKRKKAWEDMIAEENRKLSEAKSTIVPVTEKLAQTIKLLGQLGEDRGFGDQVQFYTTFFSQVGGSLKKLEDDYRDSKENSVNEIDSKMSASKVVPTSDEERK